VAAAALIRGGAVPTVLVVEDDPIFCEVVVELLGYAGYGATAAAAAGAALRAAVAAGPALILLDLYLGGRRAGDAILARLGADPATAAIPVVIMSGAAGLGEYAGRPGVAATLAKPVDLDELLALVRRLAGPAR
jgi:CheY-like chemotaxis protein